MAKVNLHPQYDSWTITNDICILDLEEAADFSSSVIDSISLPYDGEEYSSGTMCTVSGWGTLHSGRQHQSFTRPYIVLVRDVNEISRFFHNFVDSFTN